MLGDGSGMLPRAKWGSPYLPTGVPRNPRHDNAKAGWSSRPNSTVGVIGVSFWSALLSKLDNNAAVRVLVPFRGNWTEKYKLGTHEALSIESV